MFIHRITFLSIINKEIKMNVIASQVKGKSGFALHGINRIKNSYNLFRRQLENACYLLENSKRHCCMTTSECTND